MPRYKLTIEYDGTPYSGWQKQTEAPSVQAVIEEGDTVFEEVVQFAKDNGKLFSCAEWGIRVGATPANVDNPFYIRKMFEFFSANASYIAYENYFNQKAEHQLTPADVNPLASAEYLRLWGRPLI